MPRRGHAAKPDHPWRKKKALKQAQNAGSAHHGSHAPHVYFLQFGIGTPIKIGWTANLGARLQTIRSSHPEKETMLRVLPGDKLLELSVHLQLEKHRRERSEWFAPHDDVVALADRIASDQLIDALQKSIDFAKDKSIEELYAHTNGLRCPTCGRPTVPECASVPSQAETDMAHKKQ